MSLSVMASYAFANRLHVMRKAFVDLDAAEPRWGPSLSRGTAAQSLNLRLITKPLRIQSKRNGAHGAAFLRRPCLYPAIHCIGYVQCRSHGNDYTKRLIKTQYGFMDLCIPCISQMKMNRRRDGAGVAHFAAATWAIFAPGVRRSRLRPGS